MGADFRSDFRSDVERIGRAKSRDLRENSAVLRMARSVQAAISIQSTAAEFTNLIARIVSDAGVLRLLQIAKGWGTLGSNLLLACDLPLAKPIAVFEGSTGA